ncbi:MAG TPA: helicase-related protein [Puia sp.]|nr:helicase-related protein [Puia sp.]
MNKNALNKGRFSHARPEPDAAEEGRLLILNYLRKELIGPVGGQKEEIESEPPHKRYTMGILFPVETLIDKETEGEEEEVSGNAGQEELPDDPITLAGQWMPSSMGLSFFFIGNDSIRISVYGAKYVRSKESRASWTRYSIAEETSPEVVIITAKNGRSDDLVLGGNARIVGHWRPLGSGFLVTITLVNSVVRKGADVDGEDCLCQTGFECRPVTGQIQEYPSVKVNNSDPEEQELQLLYRKNRIYAVGHGCSAEWDTKNTFPDALRTQVMPMAYIPAMTHDLDEAPQILKVARLAGTKEKREVIIRELSAFTDLYEKWISGLHLKHDDISTRLAGARDRILDRLLIALSRMKSGISCLEKDDMAWKAFQLANHAMLIQMRHSNKELAGERKERNQFRPALQDYFALDYKWRPFQLAFQLLTVESVVNEKSDFRDLVDLIWFPTGGGKTEAYLALAALEIFHRRLKYGIQGGGTAVITRYTLRLLTAQQFQRSARLIAACEYLRRKNTQELGNEPVTIGFWAGMDTSPNTYSDAMEKLGRIREASSPADQNGFQIDLCPWCGTGLLPQSYSDDNHDFGFECTNRSFKVFCPSDDCLFHDSLPVSVVDEDLYNHPPSFLIATVDKFAQMAWVQGAGAFFGNNKYLPPSLVIQDELHLLSGPLGTTVGLYESAFHGLMSFHGANPKIVASTATIRSSGDQIQNLFARNVMLFPSPGLTADDSFFAKNDNSKPGRLYIGVMSSNHRATTSVVRTASALLQSIVEMEDLTEEEKDAYWTLVIYHLSLRELGKTVSFARDDIPARIKIIARAEDEARKIEDEDVLELTSNISSFQIPASLKRMERKYTQSDAVSILACTNMLSVGIDVPRLGLMMINGQPKTTSEYIQASSRVGRGKVPGVVVTHYSASKPRDRSHYESFFAYHSSIYRFVEPASVTPFSLPSRNRALHAALVILIRHGAGYGANADAKKFDPANGQVIKAINMLLEQAKIKDPDEALNTEIHLQRLVREWQRKVDASKASGYPLVYKNTGKQVPSLLKSFGDQGEGWPTLHSMRSVDPECDITVLGEK